MEEAEAPAEGHWVAKRAPETQEALLACLRAQIPSRMWQVHLLELPVPWGCGSELKILVQNLLEGGQDSLRSGCGGRDRKEGHQDKGLTQWFFDWSTVGDFGNFKTVHEIINLTDIVILRQGIKITCPRKGKIMDEEQHRLVCRTA